MQTRPSTTPAVRTPKLRQECSRSSCQDLMEHIEPRTLQLPRPSHRMCGSGLMQGRGRGQKVMTPCDFLWPHRLAVSYEEGVSERGAPAACTPEPVPCMLCRAQDCLVLVKFRPVTSLRQFPEPPPPSRSLIALAAAALLVLVSQPVLCPRPLSFSCPGPCHSPKVPASHLLARL